MVALIFGMLICIGLALAVVGLVAVPARRDGREVLTPRGEEVVAAIRAQASGTTVGTEGRAATTDAAEGRATTEAAEGRATTEAAEGRATTEAAEGRPASAHVDADVADHEVERASRSRAG